MVCEVPLLFKAHMENMFDIIIGVDVKESVQLERLSIRDKEKSAFLKRINDVNNYFDDNRDQIDFIIDNNEDSSSLANKTNSIINKVLDRLN